MWIAAGGAAACPGGRIIALALRIASLARRSQPRGAESRFLRPTAKLPACEKEVNSASVCRSRPWLRRPYTCGRQVKVSGTPCQKSAIGVGSMGA